MLEATNSTTNSTTGASASTRPKVSGLVSGINSSDIIDAFINAERAGARLMENNKKLNEARQEAVRTFNTRMLSAQLDLGNLKRASTFQSRTTTSSATDKLSITTTGTTAVPGIYTLDVVAVARAHQLSTVGQASATSSYAAGTLSLQLGDAPATAITFSAGGSLNDIATAINNSDAGISASVINDGSGSPYRLVLKGSKTGSTNDILASGTGGLSGLFTGMTTLTAASDAQVRIGSGPGAITITQASNTYTDVVPGVTFEARSEANDITLTVAAGTQATKDAITKFVESFNSAAQYLKANTGFDATTKTAGVLISQSNLVNDFSKVTRALTGTIPGAQAPYNNLAALGITINRTNGTLDIDQAKLDQVLANNAEGVRKLFMNTGISSEPSVQFSNLTEKTRLNGPFTVNITQPALQAVLSSSSLAASTVITDTNNTLDLTVNGRAVSLTLTNGTYTRSALAEHLQSSFSAVLNQTNEKLTVSLVGNQLDIRSDRYGSTQNIQVKASSTAKDALGLLAQNVSGTNVAGTINGVAGTGNGRLLNGASGSPADGLSLNVTATVPVSGVTLTASKGIGQLLGERFSAMTDNSIGSISAIDKTLSKNISEATKQITKADALLEKRRERYERQFQSMERMIAQFNSQGTAMTNFVNALTAKKT
jgi:flagellar hook-associated protein 2